MRDNILNQDFTELLSGTSLSSALSQTQVKKLMTSIADDVGAGRSDTIGATGKIGAFGFNVDALEEVGVLKKGTRQKLLSNITGDLDRVKSKITQEFNPLSGGFSLGSLGKNLQTNLVDKVKDKIGINLPENVNLSAANNINFAALADPLVWKGAAGSATANLSNTLGSTTDTINSVSSGLKQQLADVKTNMLSRVNTTIPGNDVFSSQDKTILNLSKEIDANINTIKSNLPTADSIASGIPSDVTGNVTDFSSNTSSELDNLKKQIDSKLQTIKEVPAGYLIEDTFSEIETLIDNFQSTQNTTAQNLMSDTINRVGGGSAGFLNDPVAQNNAMVALLDRNYKTLLSSKAITADTPIDTVMGLLSVANGQGVDSALKFAKGIIKTSSTGKSSLDFFNVGSKAEKLFDSALGIISSIDKGIESILPGQLGQLAGVLNAVIDQQESNEGFFERLPGGGFADPNSIYPRKSFLENDNSDVNPAAIGRDAGIPYEETTHGLNDASATKNKTVNGRSGETVSQPISEYNAEYPHNQVYQSESGHIQEFDDTPGSERIMLGHRTGTFTEIGPDGTQVNRIVGHSYTIVDNHGTITIEGKANVHVGGSCNIYVGNDANISVAGKTRIDTHGKIEWFTGEDFHLVVGGDFNIRTNKFSIDAQEMDVASETTLAMGAKSGVGISSASSVSLESGSNINLKAASGVLSSAIDTPVIDTTTANITNLNAGSTNLKATGTDSGLDSHNLTVSGPTSAGVSSPATSNKPNVTILPDAIPASTSSEPDIPEYVSTRA